MQGGPKAIYDEPFRERLRKQVEEHPDATLAEIREGIGSPIGIPRLQRAQFAIVGTGVETRPLQRPS